MVEYFQDVFIRTGGAEEVLLAALNENVSRVTVGLASEGGVSVLSQQSIPLTVLKLLPNIEVADVDRERVARLALRIQDISGDLLSFHHHFGLQVVGTESTSYYMHTPTRMLFEPERVPWEALYVSDSVKQLIEQREHHNIRAARAVMTNSSETAKRIKSFYSVEAYVVHPPTEIWKLPPTSTYELPDFYVFSAVRLAKSKWIESCAQTLHKVGIPWVIAGEGPPSVVEALPESTVLLGCCDHRTVASLIRKAPVCLSPAVEDFSIFAAEVLTMGRPVVVRRLSGVLDLRMFGHMYEFDDPLDDGGISLLASIETALSCGGVRPELVDGVRGVLSPIRFRRRILELTVGRSWR